MIIDSTHYLFANTFLKLSLGLETYFQAYLHSSFPPPSPRARQRSLHRARPSCFLLLRSCGPCQSRLVFPLNYHQDTFQTTPPCCLYYCLPHRFLAFSFVPLRRNGRRFVIPSLLWSHLTNFAFLSMHTLLLAGQLY